MASNRLSPEQAEFLAILVSSLNTDEFYEEFHHNQMLSTVDLYRKDGDGREEIPAPPQSSLISLENDGYLILIRDSRFNRLELRGTITSKARDEFVESQHSRDWIINRLKELETHRQNFIQNVVLHYERNEPARGDEASTRWIDNFDSWLENHFLGEALKFKATLKRGPFKSKLLGVSEKNHFMKNRGDKVLAYVDELSEAIKAGEVEAAVSNGEILKGDSKFDYEEREGFFMKGQYYDAFDRVLSLISEARKSVLIIDRFIDKSVLDLLSDLDRGISIKIITSEKSANPLFTAALSAFRKQYGRIEVKLADEFHDRFIVLDNLAFYHFGASIKDAGARTFMFSKIEEPSVVELLKSNIQQVWEKSKQLEG